MRWGLETVNSTVNFDVNHILIYILLLLFTGTVNSTVNFDVNHILLLLLLLLFTGTVPHSLSPYPSEEEESYFMSVPQPGCPTPPRNVKLEHKGTNSVVISWTHSKILDNMNRETNKPVLGKELCIFYLAFCANMEIRVFMRDQN